MIICEVVDEEEDGLPPTLSSRKNLTILCPSQLQMQFRLPTTH